MAIVLVFDARLIDAWRGLRLCTMADGDFIARHFPLERAVAAANLLRFDDRLPLLVHAPVLSFSITSASALPHVPLYRLRR